MSTYSRTFAINLGPRKTGLALSAQLGAGVAGVWTPSGSPITTGFSEVGAGSYNWSAAAIPAGFTGTLAFSAGGVVLVATAVNSNPPLLTSPYPMCFALNLGARRAGLSNLSAKLLAAGSPAGPAIASGFAEIGGGCYEWAATIPAGFAGSVEFASGATILGEIAVNSAAPSPTVVPSNYFERDLLAYLNGLGLVAKHGHIAEDDPLPAISFVNTEEESATKLSGTAGVCDATYQFTVMATSSAQCFALAERLRRALVVAIRVQMGSTWVYSITKASGFTQYEGPVDKSDMGTHSKIRMYDVSYEEYVPAH